MMIVVISILFLTISNMAPLNMFVADFWWIPFIRVREYYSALLWMGVVSFQPRDQTWVSCIAGRFFTVWATREAPGGINTALHTVSALSVSSDMCTGPTTAQLPCELHTFLSPHLTDGKTEISDLDSNPSSPGSRGSLLTHCSLRLSLVLGVRDC